VADGQRRRIVVKHDPDALRQTVPPGGRALGGPGCADHDRWHDRLCPRGLAAAVADAATLARLRIADRLCADGAGLEFHRSLWRALGPRALEAPARGCFRLL